MIRLILLASRIQGCSKARVSHGEKVERQDTKDIALYRVVNLYKMHQDAHLYIVQYHVSYYFHFLSTLHASQRRM